MGVIGRKKMELRSIRKVNERKTSILRGFRALYPQSSAKSLRSTNLDLSSGSCGGIRGDSPHPESSLPF